MPVKKNSDGSWCASQKGPLRPIIVEHQCRRVALLWLAEALHLQEAEEYEMAAKHGALSDELYGEGVFGRDW